MLMTSDMSKTGIYKLKFGLKNWAWGPLDQEFETIKGSLELPKSPAQVMTCLIPYREGDYLPPAGKFLDDISKQSEDSSLFCCSDKFMQEIMPQINPQPHLTWPIDLYNRKQVYLTRFTLLQVPRHQRIPVIDGPHTGIESLNTTDQLPLYIGLVYCKRIYIHPNNLPEYDLFYSDGCCWMATQKVLDLCKKHRIKGLHFEWLEGFK